MAIYIEVPETMYTKPPYTPPLPIPKRGEAGYLVHVYYVRAGCTDEEAAFQRANCDIAISIPLHPEIYRQRELKANN